MSAQPIPLAPSTSYERRGGDLLETERFVSALIPATHAIAPGGLEARERRTAQREVERQIQRAIARAERKSRRVPKYVRQSASWIHRRRRGIAHELSRGLRSVGLAGGMLDLVITAACARFPRDGIVVADPPTRPRDRGEAPRQAGTNPRAKGTNPRARGDSPRQRRRPADLRAAGANDEILEAIENLGYQPTSEQLDAIATRAYELPQLDEKPTYQPADLDALAPEWKAVKQQLLEGLDEAERLRTITQGKQARESLETTIARRRRPRVGEEDPRS